MLEPDVLGELEALEHFREVDARELEEQVARAPLCAFVALGVVVDAQRALHCRCARVPAAEHQQLAKPRNAQRHVHLAATREVERVQRHLSRWLSDRLRASTSRKLQYTYTVLVLQDVYDVLF